MGRLSVPMACVRDAVVVDQCQGQAGSPMLPSLRLDAPVDGRYVHGVSGAARRDCPRGRDGAGHERPEQRAPAIEPLAGVSARQGQQWCHPVPPFVARLALGAAWGSRRARAAPTQRA